MSSSSHRLLPVFLLGLCACPPGGDTAPVDSTPRDTQTTDSHGTPDSEDSTPTHDTHDSEDSTPNDSDSSGESGGPDTAWTTYEIPEGPWEDVTGIGNLGCARNLWGRVYCFYVVGSDLAIDQTPDGHFDEIAVGSTHYCLRDASGSVSCALATGTAVRDYGQATPPTGVFVDISANALASCGVDMTGAPACWGWPGLVEETPVTGDYFAIANTAYVACALTSTGEIECWGTPPDPDELVSPAGLFTQIAMGGGGGCALDADGYATCWGEDDWNVVSDTPTTPFRHISTAGSWACGVTLDGALECWGDWYDKDPTRWDRVTLPKGPFVKVEVGSDSGCALDEAGEITCFIGDGSPFDSPVP